MKSEQLQELSKIANIQSMQTFTLTYNRHEGRYGYRENNFPESYHNRECALEYAKDPDYTVKFEVERINLKLLMFSALVAGFLFN